MGPGAAELLERLDQLPPLPRNTLRLGELIEDPNSTPLQLARVIEQDTALAAKVMRLANSAYCAVSGGVDNLERAVCLLGYSTIHQLALCLQSLQILGEQGPPPPEALMQHSWQAAVAAQILAERLGLPLPGRLFAAGLLHDLGRLALFVLLPEAAERWPELAAASSERLAAEQELFGLDHQQTGQALAEKWNYPPPLRLAIGRHHGDDWPEDPVARRLCQALALADSWLRLSQPGPLPGVEQAPRPRLAAELELPAEPDEQFLLTLEIREGDAQTGWS